ncbi:MAG: tryptophan synthase subunit beta, partial [Anaerolinea sp.]|nr:tryptophan synthase subunit beta [Anaerolinea sp.]
MFEPYIKTGTTNVPDERGYYGDFGGRFVPETLIPALDELVIAYREAMADAEFQHRLAHLQTTYTGRPTPVTYAGRLSEHLGGAQIYLKREDL